MTYIKFESRHMGDDRWLDATPAAFVVHAWALSWCDDQDTDGRIPVRRAHRLVCPVEPGEIHAAFAVLIDLGFWIREGDEYVCGRYLSHAIASEEKNRTREKWAADKRRRRLHDNGNHDLCGPKCGFKRSTSPPSESTSDSTSGQVDDQTKPDQTPKGVGYGVGQPSALRAPGCLDCGLSAGKHTTDCDLARIEAAS